MIKLKIGSSNYRTGYCYLTLEAVQIGKEYRLRITAGKSIVERFMQDYKGKIAFLSEGKAGKSAWVEISYDAILEIKGLV